MRLRKPPVPSVRSSRSRRALVVLGLVAGIALVVWGTLRLTVLNDAGDKRESHFSALPTALPTSLTRGDSVDGADRAGSAKSPPQVNPLDFGQRIPPARLIIPTIGVDAPIGTMGLDSTGALEVPTAWADSGWYGGGAAPGQTGPAVIVGHYDSTTGPAVFYRVPSLKAGQKIDVRLTDGRMLEFAVDNLEMVSKDAFPTDQVYDPTTRPELRLITCGGSFNTTTHHYRDNVIVYAHLTTPLAWLVRPTSRATPAASGGGPAAAPSAVAGVSARSLPARDGSAATKPAREDRRRSIPGHASASTTVAR